MLLRSLNQKAEQWWYFLDHPEIPPDNNLAEHFIRLAVTKRKINTGSRSMQRFEQTADLRSRDSNLSAAGAFFHEIFPASFECCCSSFPTETFSYS